MSKFKITIFDADVDGNVHEETFSGRHEALKRLINKITNSKEEE